MANYSDPQGYLQAYFDSLGRQTEQLRAPQAPQGGILANADPVMLSLAAGLLAPTKAGSFGESIGAGLSAAQGPLQEIRRQEAARADKIAALEQARAKMALDLYDIQMGGRGGKTDDPSLIAFRYKNIAKDAFNSAQTVGEDDPRYEGFMNDYEYYTNLAKTASGKRGRPEGDVKDVSGDAKTDVEFEKPKDKGVIPRLENPEEAANLPSGTLFYDPEGVLRKVP